VRLVTAVLAMLLPGCDAGAPVGRHGDSNATQATASPPRAERSAGLQTRVFAEISDVPVAEETAVAFQKALADMAGTGGMSAMVLSADGTWGGTSGTADGVRQLRIKDQFNIGSINKTVAPHLAPPASSYLRR
jgi:hypothetical protein